MPIYNAIAQGGQVNALSNFTQARIGREQQDNRNRLVDLQAQQMQGELDDDAEWDRAFAVKDVDTMRRIDPNATQVIVQQWQQEAMAGLGDIPISRQKIDMAPLQQQENWAQSQLRQQRNEDRRYGLDLRQEARLSGPQNQARQPYDEQWYMNEATPEQRNLYDRMKGRKAEGAVSDGMNDRQRSGINMQRDAAITYAANITGMNRDEVERVLNEKGPDGVAELMNQRGGRMLQGAKARVAQSLPFGKTLVDATNADLLAPAKGGGAGIAMTQNPTGPITTPDFQAGEAQFPNPVYPLNVQSEMVRQMLKQSSPSSGPVRVNNAQEAAALPPGTTFVTPDGQTRVRK